MRTVGWSVSLPLCIGLNTNNLKVTNRKFRIAAKHQFIKLRPFSKKYFNQKTLAFLNYKMVFFLVLVVGKGLQ